MKQKLVALLAHNVKEIEEEQGLKIPATLDATTVLYGEGGFLDSMALVTFIVSIEQAIDDVFGVSVTLADHRAMSQSHSPFRTIGSLAEYAERLIQAAP